jgi:hypothetical protein
VPESSSKIGAGFAVTLKATLCVSRSHDPTLTRIRIGGNACAASGRCAGAERLAARSSGCAMPQRGGRGLRQVAFVLVSSGMLLLMFYLAGKLSAVLIVAYAIGSTSVMLLLIWPATPRLAMLQWSQAVSALLSHAVHCVLPCARRSFRCRCFGHISIARLCTLPVCLTMPKRRRRALCGALPCTHAT